MQALAFSEASFLRWSTTLRSAQHYAQPLPLIQANPGLLRGEETPKRKANPETPDLKLLFQHIAWPTHSSNSSISMQHLHMLPQTATLLGSTHSNIYHSTICILCSVCSARRKSLAHTVHMCLLHGKAESARPFWPIHQLPVEILDGTSTT